MLWRRWLFEHAHAAALNPHRAEAETTHILERMGWWDSLVHDAQSWYLACEVCNLHRGRILRPPMRSVLADASRSEILPWMDVIIDVQGPFTKGEGGEQYILSYTCTRLRVPKLAALKNLQEGHFSRALTQCVLKPRQIPEVIRSDRGPEMVSKVNT